MELGAEAASGEARFVLKTLDVHRVAVHVCCNFVDLDVGAYQGARGIQRRT